MVVPHVQAMAAQQAPRTKGQIALLVGGILLLLVALVVAGAGGTAIWASTDKDSDGYHSTGLHLLHSPTQAIATKNIDLATSVPEWLFGKIRIEARPSGEAPVFVGIGHKDDVERYLAGVQHDVLTDVDFDPFRAHYDREPGTRTPAPPAAQRFWVASAHGSGVQVLTWEVDSGSWSVVLMNADGSPGVDTRVKVGAEIPYALWIGLGVLAIGILLAAGATLMIVKGWRRRPLPPVAPPPPPPEPASV
jgi:hypothetical protein